MPILKGVPVPLAKEVMLAIFRLMNFSEGPMEFAHRLQQVMEAALLAKKGNKTEAEVIAIMDQVEAEREGTQPLARA